MKTSKILILSLLINLSFHGSVYGQLTTNPDGKLDKSFGVGGIVTAPVLPFSRCFGGDPDVAEQYDGKIVGLNSCWLNGNASSIKLTRFLGDGTLDQSFGVGGHVTYESPERRFGNKIAIQPDGKIVVAGYASYFDERWKQDFLVLRYLTNGQLDTSFGTDGVLLVDFSPPDEFSDDSAYSVLIQNDGKLIVSGISNRSNRLGSQGTMVTVVRLNEDGTRDVTFGNGSVSIRVGDVDSYQFTVNDVLKAELQTDGKILIGTTQGRFSKTPGQITWHTNLLRFGADGSLDPDFGGDGTIDENGLRPSFKGLQIFPNGKILTLTVGGLRLKRYNHDGSVDTSFGLGGQIDLGNGSIESYKDLLITSDSKIVLAGAIQNHQNYPEYAGVLRRYYSDGTPDIRFGNYGYTTLRLSANSDSIFLYRVRLTQDGKLLVYGYVDNFTYNNALLARFNARRKL